MLGNQTQSAARPPHNPMTCTLDTAYLSYLGEHRLPSGCNDSIHVDDQSMGMTTPGPDQNKEVQCQSRHDAGDTMQTSLCSAKFCYGTG